MGSEGGRGLEAAPARARRADGRPGRCGGGPRRAAAACRARRPGHHRGQVVAADRLADCVWGDRAPANPTGAMQAYVSHLRRRLQPEAGARRRDGVIARAGGGYLLRLGPDAVDAWCFERAVDSAAGHGPRGRGAGARRRAPAVARAAYAEYAGEPWVEAEVARLTELRAVARERLLEARLQLGDAALLVGELEALVAEDPLREERWRLLVLALYRAQRQADALAALRRARETLAEELGVDPGPALRSLEAEVLAQSPALDAPSPPWPRAARSAPRRSATPRDRPGRPGAGDGGPASRRGRRGRRRVGLRAHRGTGRDRQDPAARRGRPPRHGRRGPRAVRAGQPAGALLRLRRRPAAVRAAASGTPRAATRCSPAPPPARGTVFEEVAGDDARAARQLRRPARALLADRQPRRRRAAGDQRRRRPVVRQRLAALPRLPRQAARGTAGARRPARRDRRAAARRRAAREIALDPSVTVLRPAPLSPEAAGTLVRERLGEGADSFVERLPPDDLRQPAAAAPAAARAGGRGRPARRVARRHRARGRLAGRLGPGDAAAAPDAERRSPPWRARSPCSARPPSCPPSPRWPQLPEEEVAAALDTLSRGEILTDEHHLAFVHPLVRDAVYDDLPAAERALHHERAARLLRQQGAPPEQVAAHLLLAPHRGSADDRGAAARRGRGRRWPAARRTPRSLLLRRALDEPVPGHAAPTCSSSWAWSRPSSTGPPAPPTCPRPTTLLERRPPSAPAIGMVIARTHVFVSPPGVATDVRARAAAAVPARRSTTSGRAWSRCSASPASCTGSRRRATAPGRPRRSSGEGDGARMLAAALCYELLRDGEDRARAIELVPLRARGRPAARHRQRPALDRRRERAAARRRGPRRLLGPGPGPRPRHRRTVRRALGEPVARLHAVAPRPARRRPPVAGRRDRAAAHVGHLRTSLRRTPPRSRSASSSTGATWTAATASLDAARGLPWVGEGGRLLAETARRGCCLEQGRPAEALEQLTAPVDYPEVANPAWAPWRGLKARALAGLGQLEEARRARRRGGARSCAAGAPPSSLGPLPAAARRAARAARARRTCARRWTLLSGIAGRAGGGPRPARRSGDRRGRRRRGGGPAAVGADTRPRLRRTGRGPRRRRRRWRERGHAPDEPVDAPARLTSRQRRVLDLAAAGLDVNEVAQRLFLTPRTVRAVLESTSGGRRRDRPAAAQVVLKSSLPCSERPDREECLGL